MHIIIGLAIMALGAYMVIKTEKVLSAFGRMGFFEKYLGADGGSRLGYKLIGLIFIFLGIVITTNLTGNFMGWLLGPLTRGTF